MPQFIQDDEVEPCQAFGDLSGLALRFLQFERIDEFNDGEEADLAPMMLAGLDANCGHGMGLSGSRSANQHDVLSLVEELTAMELAQWGFADLAAGEVEPGQVLVCRKARRLHVVSDGADLAFGQFGFQKL